MAQEAEMDYSQSSAELHQWFGMTSPIFLCSVIGLYLLLIYKCLPAYMKNRKAYSLKTFITVYNIAQVMACIYIVVEILSITSWELFKFWKCAIFPPNTRSEYHYNRVMYFTFWLKIVELSETIVFVLRKKQNQVSYLHVFHHCSTVSLFFMLLYYITGGTALYPVFLNSNVHIIMYAYYLAAAVCDKKTMQYFLPIKKSITTIQMIQFTLILTHAYILIQQCKIPMAVGIYYTFVVCVIFYGFYDFYKKSYTTNKANSEIKQKTEISSS